MSKTLFDFIDLGDEIENVYLLKQKIVQDSKSAKLNRLAFLETKRIENVGVCEGCDCEEFLRWVDNGVYICYNCYIQDLQEECSHRVPSTRAEYADAYMSEGEWEELWYEQHGYLDSK